MKQKKGKKHIATIRLNQFKTYLKSINEELDISDAPYRRYNKLKLLETILFPCSHKTEE